jgi:endoglucanase
VVAALLAATTVGALVGAAAGSGVGPSSLRVRGNHLVFGPGRGRAVQLRGVSRSGTEYACIQGWGFFESPHPNQIDPPATIAAMSSWGIDVVRVPLNEDCWLGVNTPAGRGGAPYRRIIERYVTALNRAHLFVILDLHWAAPGHRKATGQLPMADADHTPTFWRSVATAFRHNPDVLFDLYNEPAGISWSCWRDGCELPASDGVPVYHTAGMQQLVDAVRSTGARQPLMLGGLDYATDMSGWLAHEPHDPLHQLVASVHDYGGCGTSCLGTVSATAKHVPVVFGELGEGDCQTDFIDGAMTWADPQTIGYLGWAWDATDSGHWDCASGPALIIHYNGAPTPYGAGFKAHFRARGTAIRP